MAEASLVRTVRFSARHRYRREEWSDRENRRVSGTKNEPHAHDWAVDVTVRGPIDARTGFVVETESLARWFWERLAPVVPGDARLIRVRVAESDTLAAEYEG